MENETEKKTQNINGARTEMHWVEHVENNECDLLLSHTHADYYSVCLSFFIFFFGFGFS